MKRIPLRVKTLPGFRGEPPRYETSGSSGFDVRAQLETVITLRPGERKLIPTGLAFEIPAGFELQARPRSGMAIREGLGLVNSPGTIDSDYRGEVKIIVINLGQADILIKDQDRIAQLVLAPVLQADLILTGDLSDSARGAGGFGSTGRS